MNNHSGKGSFNWAKGDRVGLVWDSSRQAAATFTHAPQEASTPSEALGARHHPSKLFPSWKTETPRSLHASPCHPRSPSGAVPLHCDTSPSLCRAHLRTCAQTPRLVHSPARGHHQLLQMLLA